MTLLSWRVKKKQINKTEKAKNQLLRSSKVVKKLAVKLNAPLNVLSAHLILINNFYIGLMERLAGVAKGLPGD